MTRTDGLVHRSSITFRVRALDDLVSFFHPTVRHFPPNLIYQRHITCPVTLFSHSVPRDPYNDTPATIIQLLVDSLYHSSRWSSDWRKASTFGLPYSTGTKNFR